MRHSDGLPEKKQIRSSKLVEQTKYKNAPSPITIQETNHSK